MKERFLFALTMSVGALLLLAQTGCSFFLQDQPPPKEAIQVVAGKDAGACLEGAADSLSQYLKKEADIEQANQVVGCIQQSIDLFLTNIEGQKKGEYTKLELETFLRTYLLKGKNVDSDVLAVLIRLKASLFGGSATVITRSEFREIRDFIGALGDSLKKLNANRDVYSLNASVKAVEADPQQLEDAIANIIRVANELGAQFHGGHRQNFVIDDLEILLNLSEKTQSFKKYLGLVKSLKSILVRPSADSIQAGEWPLAFDRAAKVYGMYLRYHYQLQKVSLLSAAENDLNTIEKVAKDALNLLSSATDIHAGQQIGVKEWSALIDELNALDALPYNLQASSLKALLGPLFTKVLRSPRPEAKGTEKSELGLTREGVARINEEFESWMAGHRLSVKLIEDRENIAISTLVDRIPVSLAALDNRGPNRMSQYYRASYVQISELLRKGRVLSWNEHGRLLVVQRSQRALMSREDLILLNAMRAGVNIVIKAYSRDPERSRKLIGINEAEAQEFYEDVRPAGVDLGLMDPRVRFAGSRSFMEGNLFTSVGDGNELLDAHEAVEFFALILSGGRMMERIEKGAAEECGLEEKDVFGGERLDAACFRRYFQEVVDIEFGNMPGLQRYLLSFGESRRKWEDFIRALEDASRASGYSEDSIDGSELRMMMPILHYTESLLVNFDKDRSGHLDSKEIWNIYPLLRSFIRNLAQGRAEDEKIQKAIFSYIVTEGKPPSGWYATLHVGARATLADWLPKIPAWVLPKKDRLDLLRIIASLNTFARESRLKTIYDFFEKHGARELERAFSRGDTEALKTANELFQCPPETEKHFAEMAQKHVTRIFAPELGKYLTPEKFTENVSKVIRYSKNLVKVCQPVM